MVDINVEENYELYDYQREYELGISKESIRGLVWELENNEIAIVQRLQKFKWNKNEIKALIISLFKGVPIGEVTMWRFNKNDTKSQQKHWLLINESEGLPDQGKLILSGFQRCVALFSVFSKKNLTIDEKDVGNNLYYNLIKDTFKFEEEIEHFDEIWINLKDTNSPSGFNYITSAETSFETKFKPILETINMENYLKIKSRIKRVFGLVNKQFNVSTYSGNNTNFASEVVHFRNWRTPIQLEKLSH